MLRIELISILGITTMAAKHMLPTCNLGEDRHLQMKICLLLSNGRIL